MDVKRHRDGTFSIVGLTAEDIDTLYFGLTRAARAVSESHAPQFAPQYANMASDILNGAYPTPL